MSGPAGVFQGIIFSFCFTSKAKNSLFLCNLILSFLFPGLHQDLPGGGPATAKDHAHGVC